ncbi:MAG: hypothetical protein CME62_03395 [Halobacteriovoraceae bacterium]|nr:hypothetical protein [Halobacteriovoraceae bacterium]|tara:strand:+ start:31644 stop:32189 length:546 start_codon:yes stop_codon:yes gene_type:complete
MKLKLLGMVLGACFIVSSANAGFLIDPYAGMAMSKSTIDIATNDDDTSSTGAALGSRLGYSFILVSAGIDYQMLSGLEDPQDESFDMTNMSAFVGVDLPILLRFWAEYFLSSDIKGDTFDDGLDDITFKDGYGLGIGFTGLPFISINLEVENLNYDIESGSTEGDYSVVNTILSASLPLDF